MKLFHILLCAVLAQPLFAELTVDGIYQSHMVLQQGQPVPVSGTTSGSGPIVVSFGDQKVKAKKKGKKWQAVLEPMAVQAEGAPLTITQGKESVTLEDVVVGEVWLASGQSNMNWRLVETKDKAALSAPSIPLFRYYLTEQRVVHPPRAFTPEERKILTDGELYQGEWKVSGPDTSARMSAVGWYFGRKLQEILGVPVGVVHVSFGGSIMLAWTPRKVIEKKYKDCLGNNWVNSKYIDGIWAPRRAKLNLGDDLSTPHPYKPSYLFETGIRPWVNFPFAGVIWYQGESDAERQPVEQNTRALTDLITSWREELKRPELPFLMVQLPRINNLTPTSPFLYWPEFREVQQTVSDRMPHVHCCVTIDLGTTNGDVHPPRKLEVGERLAALAAATEYGKQDIPYSGPTFAAAELEGGKVKLRFDHAEGLHTKDNAAPVGFELSADGKTYHPATAELKEGTVVLSSAEVAKPKYVRYAWAIFITPNLVNKAGLPTAPFTAKVAPAAAAQ